MASFPRYLYEYPNMDSSFPFYMKEQQPSRITLHRHDFLELSLVTEGTGTELINGTPHVLKPGTLAFLLPHQLHELVSNPADPLRMYVCNFDMSLLAGEHEADWGGQAFLSAQSTANRPYVEASPADLERLRGIFATLFEEYNNRNPWRNWLIKAKLIEALTLLERIREGNAERESAVSTTAAQDNLHASIWPILQYVHQNYREPLSLSGLAEHFHFHPSHLSESIKQHLGQTFTAFLQELRIRHACGLLASTDLPVTSVALEVGFGSYQTFCRLFRKLKRAAPADYRKMMHKQRSASVTDAQPD
ncbi:AraC family transcriptional regulator [Paenibacillus thalictri]|uniref:AraC family transcriptional regulator n=1 Tax=Paenibacillus thalictri TaxID=2527873 RepID=A0A4Q9DP61_9BACL|nr:AraC family transcriptional regulator [Paenibacillus thalictri]TBL75998.1 AraC family transcriptional regulator [Paenibacillus thalictri]